MKDVSRATATDGDCAYSLEVLVSGRPSRLVRAAAAGALLTTAFAVAPMAAQPAQASYCGITWGSMTKAGKAVPQVSKDASMIGVRTGHHACYDRVVVDLSSKPNEVMLGYVDHAKNTRGVTLNLRGAADMQVFIEGTAKKVSVPSSKLPTAQQVVYAGTAEGYTSVAIGTRARLPFRAFVLSGPGSHYRLVIDIAHKW